MCHRYPNATAVNVYGAGAHAIHSLAMKAVYSLRYLVFDFDIYKWIMYYFDACDF